MNKQSRNREQDDRVFLPMYRAKNEKDVLDFIEVVDREASAREWDKVRKLLLAKGILHRIAAEWRWQNDT